ncbi:LOW QUALITY PROTEIN: uncharacterized protein LOC113464164, partial [Ceratina calcarata]|uniref:LOW QUALITY PROTEIN: uncharacterized protein LOC113464164 n=1 Tax=Ceratina calcarata TaxID=156304 RepID=A0AAJ7RYP0_9HYME
MAPSGHNTPRGSIVTSVVAPGEYIHFDLRSQILKELLNSCYMTSDLSDLQLDIHTDRCALDKSGCIHVWPIQCRIANLPNSKPIVVSVYKGKQKPSDSNIFFKKLITDIGCLISSGGITFNSSTVPITVRNFIADAPARAFVLNHAGHESFKPCSKCTIRSVKADGRTAFTGVDHSLRTDDEYVRCADEQHHKGVSPLSLIPMGLVSQVPFEYMHIVCRGDMKKLFSAWVHGKYTRSTKLSRRQIELMSSRMHILCKYCPSDFARRPRPIQVYLKYKATEFRQFLLYTGPVVTFGVLNEEVHYQVAILRSLSEDLLFAANNYMGQLLILIIFMNSCISPMMLDVL